VNDFAALCTATRAQLLRKWSFVLEQVTDRTRSIGAICESSHWLAERLEAAVRDPSALPIVELGAGYGSVTGLLPANAVSIERDAERFDFLRDQFPERTILDCDATEYLSNLAGPSTVVSCIPSVNNPEFRRLRATIAEQHSRGTVAELVTYTYFPHNPFAGIFDSEERLCLEVRNLPPAFVWRYGC
jgi:phospholipid N-methyltransferase